MKPCRPHLPCWLAALPLAFMATWPATAQVPPNAHWRTVRTEHFRVSFTAGLKPLAEHVAQRAEVARGELAKFLGHPPGGVVDIVLADNVDFSNGSTTAFPWNRIVLYAHPPMDERSLDYYSDWIDLVVTHELTHTLNLDESGRVGHALRAVFGRLPLLWPLFPGAGTPGWSLEGLAVQMESRFTGTGRILGSYHEMVVRTAVLEHAFEPMSRLNSDSPLWPAGDRDYIFGSLFLDYLSRRYGADFDRRLLDATASAWLPPVFFYDLVARRAVGESFDAAYAGWRQSLQDRYRNLADSLRRLGLTVPERVTSHGRYALYPRLSPDGAHLAYSAADGRDVLRTRVLSSATGQQEWVQRRNSLGPASWLPDGSALITSQLELDGPYHEYQDLFRVDRSGEHRLTRGARLQDPAVARDGERVVAVQNGGGTNRLVLLRLSTGEQRPLTPALPGTHWALPRWSPDGRHIAVSRWREGAFYDVVVLDSMGHLEAQITTDRAVDNAPAWTPDGRFLLFSSDRSGIPNLYAAELTPGPALAVVALHQVTNLLTGAFYPEVSPDGRWIYYSGYHADGFHLERIRFDPASWRAPSPLRLPITAAQRGGGHPGAKTSRDHSNASLVLAAAADSGTVGSGAMQPAPAGPTRAVPSDSSRSVPPAVGPARPYSAFSTLWPTYWMPVLYRNAPAGTFLGAATSGADVVGRHAYRAWAAVAPKSGRWEGALAYTYAGLGEPLLDLSGSRSWDFSGRALLPDSTQRLLRDIIEQEDVVGVQARLTWPHPRWAAVLAGGPELVRRRRILLDAPGYRLIDPQDRLWGVVLRAGFANYRLPALAISREDGISLSMALRRRWETDTTARFDESYREVEAQGTAYRSLPFSGFAHHVLALRGSLLFRAGPGARATTIGGLSGGPIALAGFGVGTPSRLLPVRGFDRGVRSGTHAWTASLEYRAPLLLVGRRPRPSPLYLDRIAVSVFADAGNATCTATQRQEQVPGCAVDAGGGSTGAVISTGAELVADVAFSSFARGRLRGGVALPVRGPAAGPRFYLALGSAY